MKFKIMAAILIVFLFSCGGGQGSEGGYVTPDNTKAVNIYADLGLFATVGGKFLGTIDAGDIVEWKDKIEKDANNWDYALIKTRKGDQGWAFSSYLIRGTRPGVIVKDGFIYSEPNLSKLTKDKVTIYTIIAGVKDAKNPGFVEINYVYNKNLVRAKSFVKSDMVSFLTADVQATILYAKSQAENDPDVKKEFLKSADEMKSPAFKQVISDALNALGGDTKADSSAKSNDSTGIDTSDITASFMTLESDVPYYTEPDVKKGAAGTFDKDQKITVDKRSKEKLIINSNSDYWYHVPGKGWVFGTALIEVTN